MLVSSIERTDRLTTEEDKEKVNLSLHRFIGDRPEFLLFWSSQDKDKILSTSAVLIEENGAIKAIFIRQKKKRKTNPFQEVFSKIIIITKKYTLLLATELKIKSCFHYKDQTLETLRRNLLTEHRHWQSANETDE